MIQPGNIPQANSEKFTVNSIIAANFGRVELRMIGLYSQQHQRRNDTPILHLFNQKRIPEFKEQAGLLSLQLDYSSPKDLNAHLQIDLMRSNSKTYDPLFEDDFLLYRDSLAVVEKGFALGITLRTSTIRKLLLWSRKI